MKDDRILTRLSFCFAIAAIMLACTLVVLLFRSRAENAQLRLDNMQLHLEVSSLEQENQELISNLESTINDSEKLILDEFSTRRQVEQKNDLLTGENTRLRRLYENGVRELARKLDAIQSDAPDLLQDTSLLVYQFLRSAGAAASYSTDELLFLVSTYPDTLSEALYGRLKREQGLQRYEHRYPFSRSPLTSKEETIVTSGYGDRFRAIEDIARVDLKWTSSTEAQIAGFEGTWSLKRIDGRDVLVQRTEHLAYDLVNRRDNRVFAPFDGTIILDLPDYGPYGRTVFFEFYFDGTPYRYQLSHLSRDLTPLESGQKIASGELLGYTGNTGYTTGEHLHLALWKPNPEKEGYWMPMDIFIPPPDAQINNVLYIQYADHR